VTTAETAREYPAVICGACSTVHDLHTPITFEDEPSIVFHCGGCGVTTEWYAVDGEAVGVHHEVIGA